MPKTIKVKAVAKYSGHSIKTNKSVDLGLNFDYSELPNYIKLIQFLNEDIVIVVKLPDEDPMKLGSFRIKDIRIDHDGESTIKFNSQIDFVEADNINSLVGTEQFKVLFTASIDDEEEGGEE